MGCRATLIPGDGIGPEVAEQALRILAATGVAIEWDTVEAGHGFAGGRATTREMAQAIIDRLTGA